MAIRDVYTLNEVWDKMTADVEIFIGTQFLQTRSVTKDGAVQDLTGSKLVFEARKSKCSDVPDFSKTITETSDIDEDGQITDPTNGVYVIAFTLDDTAERFKGTYLIKWYPVADEDNNILLTATSCDDIPKFEICPGG